MLQSLTLNGRDCKWLNVEIKSEMNSREQLHRKTQRSRKERVWKIHKKQRNKCNNLIKKAKASYHRSLFEENATNPKKFWNCIKAVFPSKSCRIQTSINLNLISTVKTFSSYFSEAVKKLKTLTYPLENFTWRYIRTLSKRTKEHFTFHYISRVFVLKEFKALKRQKAPGIDELPPGLLKDCADIIAGSLAYTIYLSIKTSTVPSVWKIAKITPVFKSGDLTKPENHRPISILPIASKILEKQFTIIS